VRDIITFKVIRREIRQLTHPRAILPIRYQGRVVTSDVTNAVMAFMSLAALTTVVFTLLMMATGLDFWSSFTAVVACINVLGPGFGVVASNFQPYLSRFICSITTLENEEVRSFATPNPDSVFLEFFYAFFTRFSSATLIM